jgi:F-type H+-transporting ATPase subunit delta
MTEPSHNEHATADVGAQRVAHVYAEALLNAAASKGQANAVLEELDSLINDVFKAEPKLEMLLSSAAVGRKRREEIISKIFQGKASDIFFNFLMVLNDQERLELLRPILFAARDIADERAGRVRVHVATAVTLPEDQRQRLAEQLSAVLRADPVLELRVEPDLLAGLRVRVGDWQFDGSLRTKLADIKDYILTGTSHEIQSQRNRFSD